MNIFQWLGAGGGVTAIAALVYLWPTIQKMRAEAGKARTDAAIAVDAADDAHWKAIIAAQTEALVEPLTERLERQDKRLTAQDDRIAELERKIDAVTRAYRSALGYIRALLAWIHTRHDTPSGLPPVPPEITSDI